MSQITKRALASALKELLEHKPLNKITIADITEQCGVNRQTFYTTFRISTPCWSGSTPPTPSACWRESGTGTLGSRGSSRS